MKYLTILLILFAFELNAQEQLIGAIKENASIVYDVPLTYTDGTPFPQEMILRYDHYLEINGKSILVSTKFEKVGVMPKDTIYLDKYLSEGDSAKFYVEVVVPETGLKSTPYISTDLNRQAFWFARAVEIKKMPPSPISSMKAIKLP